MLYVNSDVEDLKSNILMRGNNKPRKSGFVVLNCFHLVNHFGKRVRAWFQVIRSIQRIWIVDSHKTSSKLVQLLLSFVKLTETCFASKINIFDFCCHEVCFIEIHFVFLWNVDRLWLRSFILKTKIHYLPGVVLFFDLCPVIFLLH